MTPYSRASKFEEVTVNWYDLEHHITMLWEEMTWPETSSPEEVATKLHERLVDSRG